MMPDRQIDLYEPPQRLVHVPDDSHFSQERV